LTPPPLGPVETDPGSAVRARAFANWLASDEFLTGHPNFFTFDLFDLLAEDDPQAPDYSMLLGEYRPEIPADSHPNALANGIIGPQLAEFIINAAESYRSSLE
jgi:hypothetical protein